VAEKLAERLRPACERLELAGSLRRKKALVGDIELVAIPKLTKNLFGEEVYPSQIDLLLAAWGVQLTLNGQKMKQFILETTRRERYQVDLFLQPDPATWGVNFMIRTGSADFTKWMVTKQEYRGACPNGLAISGARVHLCDTPLLFMDTPEEEDVFRLWNMDFIPPEEREEARW
jgi:DNA polymerase/3'-5' exonuclease PolX